VIAKSKQREAFKIPKMRVPANKAKQTQLVRRRAASPSDDEPTDKEGRGCYAVIAFVIVKSKQREAFKIPKMRVPANKAKQTQLVRRRAARPSGDEPTDKEGRGCYAVIAFVIVKSKQREAFKIPKMRVPANKAKQTQLVRRRAARPSGDEATDKEGRGCYAVIALVIAESKQREAFRIPKIRVPANKAKQTQLVRRRAASPSDDEPTDKEGRGCYAVIAFVIAESKQREAFKIPKMRVPANKAKQTQLVRRRAARPSDDEPTDKEGRGCYAVIAFMIAESKQREAFKIPKMRVLANKAKQTQLVRRRAAGPGDDKPTDKEGRRCYSVIAFVIAEGKQREAFKIPMIRVPANKAQASSAGSERAAGPSDNKQTVYEQ
jgi:hypothetical protein